MKKLTYRENEVIKLISTGKTTQEISDILNISKNTINVHIRAIYQKIDVNNRTSAALVYLQNKKFFEQL